MGRKEKPRLNLPEGTSEPARRERARFEAQYKAFLTEIQKTSLSILVWGPNTSLTSPIAEKRMEIRQKLMDLGHNAMFSEDISIHADNISAKSKEFAQARVAHLIIILVEDAPDALAEAHDFCNHPNIAPNVYVMIPKKYETGYSAQGAIKDLSDAYGSVYWYEEDELGSCNVLNQAVKRAEARRCIRSRTEGTMP